MPSPVPHSDLRYPRLTVGVMGSAGGRLEPDVLTRVFRFGQEVGRRGHILITGACPGIPHEAVKGAKSEGGFVVGVSPALNFKEHVRTYSSPTRGYDVMIYSQALAGILSGLYTLAVRYGLHASGEGRPNGKSRFQP